ncbi:hypothetical protein E2C01_088972 [Portunus trituberculatus]|uniref:Uncharacterized protein n=1 Tax=Portunus trituberculatus TaxID=210409 RepID=A0A5B7JL04_PORTR|nr:hypothetical protein [Portunus trituberculatus]
MQRVPVNDVVKINSGRWRNGDDEDQEEEYDDNDDDNDNDDEKEEKKRAITQNSRSFGPYNVNVIQV